MELTTRTASQLGSKLAAAHKQGDKERAAAIERQFQAMLPYPGEYGAAREDRARWLEAYHDGYSPRRRG